MGRYRKVQVVKKMKKKKKKGAWSEEEDQKLAKFIDEHGLKGFNWETISEKAGLNRCGKSCRLRWKNYLNPHIRRGNFSQEEESTIIHLHSRLGNKWSQIAAELPGRTDNDIKNYWNTKLRKKLQPKSKTEYLSSHYPQTPTTDIHNFLANYLINIFSNLLGFLNMPLSDQSAQNLLLQEWERIQQLIIVMSSTHPNYPFLLSPDHGLGKELDNGSSAIPCEFSANLTSGASSESGLYANSFDCNDAGICSNCGLTEYDMLPALVSATGGEILMPVTDDQLHVDSNLVPSSDYEWIANGMNCPGLSPPFMEGVSSSEIYVEPFVPYYDEFRS